MDEATSTLVYESSENEEPIEVTHHRMISNRKALANLKLLNSDAEPDFRRRRPIPNGGILKI